MGINHKAEYIEHNGETKSISGWALDQRCVVSGFTLRKRIRDGWPIEMALTFPPKPPMKNILGRRFGRLVVTESLGSNKNQQQILRCKCDCGNEKITNIASLGNMTFSCGCLRRENIIGIQKRFTKEFTKESLETWLFNSYVRGAYKRKFEWKLSIEEFVLFLYQNCFYCGQIPSQILNCGKEVPKHLLLKYNGIDRKDSHIGYIKDNCVTCCKNCNYAKRQLGLQEFLEMIKRIYEKHFNIKK